MLRLREIDISGADVIACHLFTAMWRDGSSREQS